MMIRSHFALGALMLLVASTLTGCSKDGEIQQFIQENDALVQAIKTAADPDAAQKIFDGKKDGLKAKLAPLKTARGFQVKQESMTALMKSVQDGVTGVCGLQIAAIQDQEKMGKYKTLCKAYSDAMTMD